jgi:hypothetical protein
MGNDHLYNFKIGKRIIDSLTPMGDVLDNGGVERPNADDVALSEVAKRVGSKLEYEYDFGDCWILQIVVEKRLEDGDAKDGLLSRNTNRLFFMLHPGCSSAIPFPVFGDTESLLHSIKRTSRASRRRGGRWWRWSPENSLPCTRGWLKALRGSAQCRGVLG